LDCKEKQERGDRRRLLATTGSREGKPMFTKKKARGIGSISLSVLLALMQFFVIFPLPIKAAGSTYYVSKNGSDLNPGTETQPFFSIQKAADVAQEGDTVTVKEGIYSEDVTAPRSGTSSAPITFKNYGKDKVVVEPGTGGTGFNFNGRDYLTLEGFEFRGGKRGVYNNDSSYTTYGLTVKSNYVHDTEGDGMYLRGVNETLVIGNKVINAGAPGYGSCVVVGGGVGNVIEGNELSNPGEEDGIKTWGTGTVIRGNYIHYANGTGHSDGVQIQSGKYNILEYNIIENARSQALMAKSTSDPSYGLEGLIVRGNVIYMTPDFPEAGTIRLNIHSAPNSQIYNNTVHGGYMGLRFTDNSFGVVKNNIFYDNDTDNGVDPTTSDVDYNIYWGGRQGTPAQNGDNGVHSRQVDPKFLDPAKGNFRLLASSPAIDAGTSDGAPTRDIDGNFRYDKPDTLNTGGGAYPYYDIGGYEHQGSYIPAPDTTPPTVFITSPSNNSTVSGTVNVAANATDNLGISKVEFYVDNVLRTNDSLSPYTYSLDTWSLTNGTHTIKAKAYDTSGLTSEASIAVSVDNVSDTAPPQISDVSSSSITSNSAQISWTTDEASTSQVEYGTTPSYGSQTSLDQSLLTSHSQTLTNLSPNTTHHFRVKSRDSSGNEAVSSDYTFITSQTPQPAEPEYIWLEAEDSVFSSPMTEEADALASGGSYIYSPLANAGGSANYTFSAATAGDYVIWGRAIAPTTGNNSFFVSADSNPEDIWDVLLNESSSAWKWDKISLRGEGTFDNPQFDPKTFSFTAGLHTLEIKSREADTYLDKILITNDLSYVPQGDGDSLVDTYPPVVSISSPSNNSTVAGTVSVVANATDNLGVSKVEFYIDGALLLTDVTVSYGFEWHTTLFSDGAHTIEALAIDSTGNRSSHQVDVTVANVASNVSLASNGGILASYSRQESNGPANGVIDGKIAFNADYKTWFVKYPKPTEQATIKFSDLYLVKSVNHWNDGQYGAKSVTIKHSKNGVDWYPLGTYNLSITRKIPQKDVLTFTPVFARYLRFEYTSFNHSRWFQVNELEIFGVK